MTRLFTNSELLSKLGECNIYYISINIYILYLGLENTTLSNQNFISNKKIYTLMFWSGNRGNRGNRANKALKLQQSLVPTFGVFGSHSSHFPFCIGKLPTLFFKDFLFKVYISEDIYRYPLNLLIFKWLQTLTLYFRGYIKLLTSDCFKPPDSHRGSIHISRVFFGVFIFFRSFYCEGFRKIR